MNNLIHQIYATALDASQWPNLLISLNQGLEPSQNDTQASLANQKVIQAHVSQAIEISKRQNDTDDKKSLIESSLSLLPIALFTLTNKNSTDSILALNYKAEVLLPELKLKLARFFLESKHKGESNNIHSRHILHDDQAYLFLHLPIQQIDIEEKIPVVLVSLSNQHLFNDSALFARWNFSRKETAICKLLLEGESIQSISLKNCRSVHTIRSQVKSIFQKSGLHSQTDLIRHFYSSPISIAAIKTQNLQHSESTLESFKLRLMDDRIMSWAEHGDRNGTPVVLCHTMHQSRLLRHPDEIYAKEMKIRVITPDRPGYGDSDPNNKGSIKDWPNDLAELMQHLQIENFALLGLGLGSIFALKSAQTLGKQITQTTCVNMPFYIKPTIKYWSMNVVENAACKLAKYSPKVLLKLMKLAGRDLFLKEPSSLLLKMYPCTGENDLKVLNNEVFQRQLAKDFSESNKQGFGRALVNEINYLLNHKRIFEPASISTPVSCWYRKNCNNPNEKDIEDFIAELSNAKSICVDSNDDFMIYHEWKNYLYETAFGNTPNN